ncbi:isochorismate synthase DhbC [Sorangium sp. So ce1036]|uniref:isochorismate synthase DhbC n=1 Tax=Sorangium sp. So ce1036 TaxID=3133328 RepID=UPI003F0EC8CA
MTTTLFVPDAAERPASNAAQLLEQYSPESSFFFASPTCTLLAQGVREMKLEPERGDRLAGRVAALLAASEGARYPRPIVVGAVPFNNTSPARLIVPRTIQSAGPLGAAAVALRPRAPVSIRTLRMIPEPRDYVRGVEQAVSLMQTGALCKVVLSRMMELVLSRPIDLQDVLRRLAQHNRSGYTFAANLWESAEREPGPEGDTPTARPRTLIGASPELLVSRSGLQVVANPLAGSAARSPDPEEDRRRANALLTSRKDRHEHAIVVEAVTAALRPFCRRLHVPEAPSLTHTATMWHLATRVTGELDDLSISSMKLAMALHPTPAVCGYPAERARAAIESLEPFDRGFFTGIVGWCDAAGDGEWAVAIRCADIAGRSARLYAGAGLVLGSDGDMELAETSAKLRTMGNALGLDLAPEMA